MLGIVIHIGMGTDGVVRGRVEGNRVRRAESTLPCKVCICASVVGVKTGGMGFPGHVFRCFGLLFVFLDWLRTPTLVWAGVVLCMVDR